MSNLDRKRVRGEVRNLKEIIGKQLLTCGLDELKEGPLLMMVVNYDCPLECKYGVINMWQMIKDNYMVDPTFSRLMNCCGRLASIGLDLLKPESQRPSTWRIILFDHNFLKTVDCVKGSHTVLTKFGYTVMRSDSFSFPTSSQPNTDTVLEMTVELLVGKAELDAYVKGYHDYPHHIQQLLPSQSTDVKETFQSPVCGEQANKKAEQSLTAKTNDRLPAESRSDRLPAAATANYSNILPAAVSDINILMDTQSISSQCDICGLHSNEWICYECDNKLVCTQCDQKWHQHPKRRHHQRTRLNDSECSAAAMSGSPLQLSGVYSRTSSSSAVTEKPNVSKEKQNAGGRVSELQSPTKSLPGLHDTCWTTSSISDIEVTYPPSSLNEECSSDLQSSKLMAASGDLSWRQKDANSKIKCLSTPTVNEHQTGLTLRSSDLSSVQAEFYTHLTDLTSKLKEFSSPTNHFDTQLKDFSLSMDESATELKTVNLSDENELPGYFRNSLVMPSDLSAHVLESSSSNVKQKESKHMKDFEQQLDVSYTAMDVKTVDSGTDDELKALLAQAKYPPNVEISEFVPPTVANSDISPAKANFASLHEHQKSREDIRNWSRTASKQPSQSLVHRESDLPGVIVSRLPEDKASNFEGAGLMVRQQAEYQSIFVEIQDQVYHEKKAAQKQQEDEEQLQTVQHEESLLMQNQHHQPVRGIQQQQQLLGEHENHQLMLKQCGHDRKQQEQEEVTSLQQHQNSQQDKHSLTEEPLSFTDRLASIQRQKQVTESLNNARSCARTFKLAEEKGFYQEELDVVLNICSSQAVDPHTFFSSNWMQLVDDVVGQVRVHLGLDAASKPSLLARISLAKSKGRVPDAVVVFTQLWNEKVNKLLRRCQLPVTEDSRHRVSTQLAVCHGNDEEAMVCLTKDQFLNHIYVDDVTEETSHNTGDVYEQSSQHMNEHLAKMLKDNKQDNDRRLRAVLCEARLKGWRRAQNVVSLLTGEPSLPDNVSLSDVVEAVESQSSLADCLRFLQKECQVCFSTFPPRQITNSVGCQCSICPDCLQSYFELVIKEQYVRNLVCPVCGQPDIDKSEQMDLYFELLTIMLRRLLSDDVFELFQTKLRDWNLMMDPSFRWCAYPECGCGFVVDAELADRAKVICPNCNKAMCQHCKKVWEDQHEGLSCDEFQQWKEANDPEFQAMALARHLEENGIECPRCKCRYSLAKGGCMHFTCYQCRHEFCSGCLETFKHGKCTKYKSCAKAGLHCHHPRNCLFYLRDRDVKQLQKLLQDHNVAYNTKPATSEAGEPGRCSVMEQKQMQNGFKDEPCGKDVPNNFAGLCEIHYKEYLVGLINRHGIDPAKIMTDAELTRLLERAEKNVPQRKPTERTNEYKKRLLELVQRELPLSTPHKLPMPTAGGSPARQRIGMDVVDNESVVVLRKYLADGSLHSSTDVDEFASKQFLQSFTVVRNDATCKLSAVS